MSGKPSEHIAGLNTKLLSNSRSFSLIIWTSLIIVFIITSFDIAGWIFDLTLLKSIGQEWEPMQLITAICFIISALSLIIIRLDFQSIFIRAFEILFASLICFISLISLYSYLYLFRTFHESPVTNIAFFSQFLSPDRRMAFLTSCSFFLIGIVLILLPGKKDKSAGLAHLLIIPVFLISYFTLISYLLGVYNATSLSQVAVALNTGIAFTATGIAVLHLKPRTWLMKLYSKDNIGGFISRRLLLPAILLPMLIGWLRIQGERKGLFASEQGVVIVAITYTFCFIILVWLTARYVNKIDERRQASEEILRENREQLSAVFNGVSETLMLLDIKGNIIAVNNTAKNRFSDGSTELTGKNIYDLIPLEFQKVRKEQISEIIRTKKPVKLQDKLKDTVLDLTLYPVFDANGNVKQCVSFAIDITERKQAELALKESEEKLWSVLNATQESIYMFDRDGIITMSNSTGMERLDIISENKLIGHHFSEFLSPLIAMKRKAKLEEVFNSGKPLEFEDDRDGRMYNHNYFPVYKDDKVTYVVTYSTDITARKKAEANLKESEDRFRTIAESLPVLIAIYSLADSNFSFINESFENTFGVINGDPVQRKLHDFFFNPDDRNDLGRLLKENGRAYNRELKVKKADGTPFWIMTSIRKISFMNDQAYLTASINITETKKAQEELLRLNRTLNAKSKSSQAMMHSKNEFRYLNEVCKIIIEDCGHTMVWVGYAQNDEHKTVKPVAYFGFDEGYIDQLNVTWDDTERGSGPTGTAIRTGKPSLCKNMMTDPAFKPWRKAALERGYASSLTLPLIQEGKTFGSISIYSKEADPFSENEIKLLSNLADDLAYGISYIRLEESERTAANVIRENEAKLKELVATKDKFFNIVAHDLKNPFTSLLGSSELLFENIDQLNTRSIQDLALILNDSAKSGYAILQNLLDWSRSQTGLLKINPENINLRELIDENVSTLQLPAANKEIKMVNLVNEDIIVCTDKNMINTILRNILSNALKFTYKSGKVIVRTEMTTEEVIVSVKDNGIGIPEEKIESLFNIEVKNSLPGTENEQGTGLGLKLTREFVEKLGGRIWVVSVVGKGSEFNFSIPLKGVKA
jgi:PAS domain S-box-containing protein